MTIRRRNHLLMLMVVTLMLVGKQARSAEESGGRFAHAVSDSVAPFLIAGELSLLSNGDKGKSEAFQGAKALLLTELATEVLKAAVRDKRPNSESLTSFPSSHTSAAFAMATVLADYEPKLKWPAYTLASAIGWSRVRTGAHRWDDVIAGALIGHFIAKRCTRHHIVVSPHGLSLCWEF